jgi:hypothetical protein
MATFLFVTLAVYTVQLLLLLLNAQLTISCHVQCCHCSGASFTICVLPCILLLILQACHYHYCYYCYYYYSTATECTLLLLHVDVLVLHRTLTTPEWSMWPVSSISMAMLSGRRVLLEGDTPHIISDSPTVTRHMLLELLAYHLLVLYVSSALCSTYNAVM